MSARALRHAEQPGRGLPGCAWAVSVPASTKPNPSASQAASATPSLSKPAASPTGLGKRTPKTVRASAPVVRRARRPARAAGASGNRSRQQCKPRIAAGAPFPRPARKAAGAGGCGNRGRSEQVICRCRTSRKSCPEFPRCPPRRRPRRRRRAPRAGRARRTPATSPPPTPRAAVGQRPRARCETTLMPGVDRGGGRVPRHLAAGHALVNRLRQRVEPLAGAAGNADRVGVPVAAQPGCTPRSILLSTRISTAAPGRAGICAVAGGGWLPSTTRSARSARARVSRRARDPGVFHGVGGVAQAGGVDQAQRQAAHVDELLDGVARGAGRSR